MLYSKNGSIPKPETDGTEGWIEVPDAPECPAGKEVVWWYPPGWVIRDPAPGADYSWSQSEERWVQYVPTELPTEPLPAITSDQVAAMSSASIGVL
jgi:hypothetical protein